MTTLTPALAAAQTAPASADSASTLPRRRICWRGRPTPRCDAFWLTEVGYYRRAAGTTLLERYERPGGPAYEFEREDLGNHLAWEVGGMVNRGSRAAVGGTLDLGFGGRGGRIGLKGRYRRWLDAGGTSIDAAAGVIGAEVNVGEPAVRARGTGLTADLSLNASDFGAVTVRTDVVRGGGRTASAVYGGVRLGSRPAVIGTGLIGLGLLAFLAALSAAYN